MTVTSIKASYLLKQYGLHPLTWPPSPSSTNVSTDESQDHKSREKLAKKRDINSFTFRVDDNFLSQLVKFEEIKIQMEELEGVMSDQELGLIFLDALSFIYKEKLSVILRAKGDEQIVFFFFFFTLETKSRK